MSPILSICIPVYNFADYISETLESILPQLSDLVEVVVLDGASTDHTPHVIAEFQKRSPYIRYCREPKKGGIDHDISLCFTRAQGVYCWLFGGDDILLPGAVNSVLSQLKENCDLYLANFNICGYEFDTVLEKHSILDRTGPAVYHLSNPKERENYFSLSVATPAFFSFLGSLIIKRNRWAEIDDSLCFMGTCWSHAARLFRMIPQGLTVKYMDLFLLSKRSYNDSFIDERGFVYRIALAIDGLLDISYTIFGKQSPETFYLRRALQKEFPLHSFLSCKKDLKRIKDYLLLVRLLQKTHPKMNMKKFTYILCIALFPSFFVAFLQKVYRYQKKMKTARS
jgi:abequosyltransferase